MGGSALRFTLTGSTIKTEKSYFCSTKLGLEITQNKKIIVKDIVIYTYNQNENDYISLTDIARFKDKNRTDYVIQNWMRNRYTVDFLGIWEQINNPNFKPIEFDGFKKKAGLNSFILTAKQKEGEHTFVLQSILVKNQKARWIRNKTKHISINTQHG
jgi:hypothetical protein